MRTCQDTPETPLPFDSLPNPTRTICSLPADVLWGSFVTHSFLMNAGAPLLRGPEWKYRESADSRKIS